MSILSRLFEFSGTFECICKCVGYSTLLPHKQLRELYHKLFLNKGRKCEINPNDAKDVIKYIDSLDINNGDTLIVHSSMDGLKSTGLTPKQIIDYLLERVGDKGTLVVPAFPVVNVRKNNNKVPLYNPKRTICWTGALPNTFLTYSGAKRSSFPYNSLAAIGKNTDYILSNNLSSDTPHGINSAWYHCIEKHAKILYLGVRVAECNTMLHIVEDVLDEKWPIKNWYTEDYYKIKLENEIIEKKIRACSGKWIKFNICYNYNKKLKDKKLIQEQLINGIPIGFTPDSNDVFDYMLSEAEKGKIRYKIPFYYWK